MKIPGIARWALRQALGTARGALVIGLLEGPIGALLDTAEQWPGLRAKQRQAELRAGVSYLAADQSLVDLLMASADSTLPVILHNL